MSLPFVHQRLEHPSDEIRLLLILQGGRNDPITCTLQSVQRKAEPKYGAVSYTWGDPGLLETIYINSRPLVVRHNCYFALWQLRLHEIDSPIWIDSICINQNDNHEKSKQVLLMGSIYANAAFTMACIGDSLQLRAVASDIASIDTENVQQLRRRCNNLSLLASNGYFKRLWIVQELYHSKNISILCGEDILSWDNLEPYFLETAEVMSQVADLTKNVAELSSQDAHLVDLFLDLTDLNATELARFIHFRKFRMAQLRLRTEWTDEITGSGFTGVILSFGEGACVDPRDKIYGLLSLAQDSRWLVDFPVSYTRPLTDVLIDVVSRIASESLTENTSRLIANMLRWFEITPGSMAGQSLLESRNRIIPMDLWRNSNHNVTPFDSVRVWRVSNLPLSSNTSVPDAENIRMRYNGASERRQSQPPDLDWLQICAVRGHILKSFTKDCFIAGSDVRLGDLIVEFNAMRDDEDEYTTAVICRRLSRNSNRLDVVDQATLVQLTQEEDYMSLNSARLGYSRDHREGYNEYVSTLKKEYLVKRMLFARPCKERVTVNLRPFDLITSVMTRSQILNRIRYPIRSCDSGCYAELVEVDEAEVRSRTYTITQPPPLYETWSRPPSPPPLY